MTTTPQTALITGITGQDGSYLADFYWKKGYTVRGIKRRASCFVGRSQEARSAKKTWFQRQREYLMKSASNARAISASSFYEYRT